MFDHTTTMPCSSRRQQTTKASLLSTLMTKARANTAALFRFLYDKDHLENEEHDTNDDNNNLVLFGGFLEMDKDGDEAASASASIPTTEFLFTTSSGSGTTTPNRGTMVQVPLPAPKPKKRRTKYPRRNQRESLWWTRFLAPAQRADLLLFPNGRLAAQFRKLFHTPYDVYLDLMNLATERWWEEWSDEKRCRAGKLVSSLDLKLLGALFVLAQGVTHFVCSTCSNLSEEVHRSFFQKWIRQMSSIKDEFIFMPHDDFAFQKVTEEYEARGLPGCIGSVDCVHIGWDRCPTQYKNMYSGKEGYPSVAYEVICTCRKFIQSVSCGHPGTRNDKHIAKTDPSVMQLLESNGWLNSKAWHTIGPHGTRRTFFGAYLICDGGYHAWPCLMSPSKKGMPDSPEMRWTKNLESIRKDIEGVFGILKIRFRFLKNFNNLRTQSSIDNAFVTCCMLHNMILRSDGYLDDNLPPYPGGLEESLARKFGRNRWNGVDGLWIRDEDDQPTTEFNNHIENALLPPLVALPTPRFFSEADKKALKERHRRVKNALVEHFEYGAGNN